MLNVAETLSGRRILFVGATGFVGKVTLSMLLRQFPDIGKVFALVRPGAGSTSEQRFFEKVATSPVFDPIRDLHGGQTEAFLRERVVALAGDLARPGLNFSDEDLAQFGDLDVIVNAAGLVDFAPSLEQALRINTLGVRNVVDVARRTGAGVVHISTCFVVGNRDGEIWEEVPRGYYPRQDELLDGDFDIDAEIADCQRIIVDVKELAKDHAHVSLFRDRAAKRLAESKRSAEDERTLRIAVARERKIWIAERLSDLGMERAQHWGWPNIYTYTKSLGDQVLASAGDVRYALVRPAIVETSVRYPFPGWNEGFTTSAPLIFLHLKGHRTYPAHPKANLDIVPCDLVASCIIAVTAAVIAGEHENVYQASTSDTSPLSLPRTVELTALSTRRYWKNQETGNKFLNNLRSRLEAVPRGKSWYNFSSSPAFKNAAESLSELIKKTTPRWGAPRLQSLAADATRKLDEVARLVGEKNDLFQLFMPFIYDRHYVFRSDNVRALFASMTPADREVLIWDPEKIEWRDYFFDTHIPALRKWVFPDLEAATKPRPPSVYTYRDLLEMFDITTKLHRQRVAMRSMPAPDSTEPMRRYTYKQLHGYATRAAAILREAGIGPGDRVALLAEGRPEWGITYFGILKAGGTAVPVDEKATTQEVSNILRHSRCKVVVLSSRTRAQLDGLEQDLLDAGSDVILLGFDELLLADPRKDEPFEPASRHGDDLASIIFTSGTTGTPKGVELTHRNFTSLLAKLVTIFNPTRHDKLLSVLPLHHTFEFTTGLLMPLARGGQITYLEELTPDTLNAAFEEGEITAMIGVPALWQLLHRKITKAASDRGPWVEEAFNLFVEGSRRIRDKTGINVGKLLFWPIQKKLGGRIRLLVSGGSSLPPEVMDAFRGMGFDLFEGYGLTEAAPVLTAQRPGSANVSGSVGEPLPGVDVRIKDPDHCGVGEIIARGPNIMKGYFEDPDATADALHDGWLHTGDLGRFDDDKRLYIVGRKKEMILTAEGENIYPDELEELYRDSVYVKELSIAGLPRDNGQGELVACLLVPDYGAKGADGEALPRGLINEKVREHVKKVSNALVNAKRIKVLHLWDGELPRTATQKVRRTLVVRELQKLQRTSEAVRGARVSSRDELDWIAELVASVCQRPRDSIEPHARLEELGFDSLMYAELASAMEAAGVALNPEENLQGIGSVSELAQFVGPRRRAAGARGHANVRRRRRREAKTLDELPVREPFIRVGRKVLRWGQRLTYERIFDTKVTGRAYLPQRAPFMVVSNHASHLDMGLVKHALGDWGPHMHSFAAKDYFFEHRLKRAYFGNFTNLIPMDRHGSLRESLRLAESVLRRGNVLLIFPEGTRSITGVMADFKPSLGYLALRNQVDVLPMYLAGTHDAFPKGASWPKRRKITAHIGPVLPFEELRTATKGMPHREQHREAAWIVEAAVRKLGQLPPPAPLSRAPKKPRQPVHRRGGLGDGHEHDGDDSVDEREHLAPTGGERGVE